MSCLLCFPLLEGTWKPEVSFFRPAAGKAFLLQGYRAFMLLAYLELCLLQKTSSLSPGSQAEAFLSAGPGCCMRWLVKLIHRLGCNALLISASQHMQQKTKYKTFRQLYLYSCWELVLKCTVCDFCHLRSLYQNKHKAQEAWDHGSCCPHCYHDWRINIYMWLRQKCPKTNQCNSVKISHHLAFPRKLYQKATWWNTPKRWTSSSKHLEILYT